MAYRERAHARVPLLSAAALLAAACSMLDGPRTVTLSVLQCLPLPAWLRGALSPGLDATLRLVLTDLGGYPAESLPLSLDPAESAHETVRLLGYLCLLWAWSTLRSRQGDSFRLAGLVVAAAVVAAGPDRCRCLVDRRPPTG